MTAELVLPRPVNGLAALDADLANLDPSLRSTLGGLVKDGIPKNTDNTYTRLYRRFDKWCHDNGHQSLPMTAAALGGYLTVLSNKNAQPSTLRHLVSVLTARQKAEGYGGLSGPIESMVDKAIRGHVEQRRYGPQQLAYPLVPHVIREVASTLDYETFVGRRAGLILSLGYSAVTRRSELEALRVGDVTFRPGGLSVYFWKSKTDQGGVGMRLPVPEGHHMLTDPVTRLREYLEALASFGVDITDPTLPLLRSVTSAGKPRPLIIGKDGKTYGDLKGDAVSTILRNICRSARISHWDEVSGHSLRAGFATACAFSQNPQIPLSAWAVHGRWSLTSRVPMLYVRDAQLVLDNPLQFVGV